MPSFIGATRPIIALVATAASIALPPVSRIFAPTCEARTLSLATTPDCEATIERDCERSWPQAALTITLKATAAAICFSMKSCSPNIPRRGLSGRIVPSPIRLRRGYGGAPLPPPHPPGSAGAQRGGCFFFFHTAARLRGGGDP